MGNSNIPADFFQLSFLAHPLPTFSPEQVLQIFLRGNSPISSDRRPFKAQKVTLTRHRGLRFLRKSHSQEPKGALSQGERATVVAQLWPFCALVRARFQPSRVVNNIQTPDYQCAGNILKIRVFSPIRPPDENNAGSEPKKQQIV